MKKPGQPRRASGFWGIKKKTASW